MNKLLFIAMILFTQCASREKVTPDLDSLSNTIREFNQAFAKYDVDLLNDLTTENYLHTNGNSKPIEKEDWLSYLRKRRNKMEEGLLVITRYELSDTVLRVHSSTGVIVSGRMDIEGVEDQMPFFTSLRVTNFWVHGDTGWQRAAFHDTKIEAP
ncbi:MAG: nuclear transport factor 2 family protein [Cyclobacteriaceae bacterium]